MGLAFDRNGNLYAANFVGNTVEKFAPNGTDLGVFANVISPTGLAFDAAGNLYVANFGSTIERFAPNGTPLGAFATFGLNNPEGLAFDSSGNLYVANNGSDTIEVFSPERRRPRRAHERQPVTAPSASAFDTRRKSLRGQWPDLDDRKIYPERGRIDFRHDRFQPGFHRSPKDADPGQHFDPAQHPDRRERARRGFHHRRLRHEARSDPRARPVAGRCRCHRVAWPIRSSNCIADSTGVIIAENDNWKKNQQAEIEATGLPPSNDAESALITTLSAGRLHRDRARQARHHRRRAAGRFTISAAGFGPELANISTRGFVDTGSNVMIAGFIAASGTGGSGRVHTCARSDRR